MQRWELSSTELAVLVDHMTGGALLENESSRADFELNDAARAAVEEDLFEAGLLVSLPFEPEAGVTTPLATVLGSTLSPECVCIVRSIEPERTNPPVIFSFTDESITRNASLGEARHEFEQLADREVALDSILAAGKALDAPQPGKQAKPAPVAELLEQAVRLVTVLVAANPSEADSQAESLAWLETDQGLWLMDPASDGESPVAIPMSATELRKQISAALDVQLSA